MMDHSSNDSPVAPDISGVQIIYGAGDESEVIQVCQLSYNLIACLHEFLDAGVVA